MRFYPKLSIENVHEIDEQNVLSNLSDENVLISNLDRFVFSKILIFIPYFIYDLFSLILQSSLHNVAGRHLVNQIPIENWCSKRFSFMLTCN